MTRRLTTLALFASLLGPTIATAGPILDTAHRSAATMTLAVETEQGIGTTPRGRSKAKLFTSLAIVGVGLVGAFGAAETCEGVVFFDDGERFCLGDVRRDRAQVIGFSMVAAAGAALAALWK